ncbi:5-oxoprolinase [Rhinophrynus dorsalis]
MVGPDKFQFAIDRGGTFTDVFARCPGGKVRVMKLLSEDPGNYRDAPTEGIRRILEEESGVGYPRDQPLDTGRIEWIRMGTTVATNALLERKGERIALLITRGFRDLLHIGNQARPKIFDLEIQMPEVLYEEVIEVEERVVLKREGCCLPKDKSLKTFIGSTGEALEVWEPINLKLLERDLRGVLSRGIQSLAVVLMHSYTWSSHEHEVGVLARSLGFTHVSLSSEVMPMIRMVPRGYTACADAYLTPCIQRYLDGFCSGFKNQLKDLQVLFMRSDGGLTPMHSFSGSRAILSGPAGGVVGYAITTYHPEHPQPVIGFDMGGTSTDVSRYDGEYEHVFEATTAGISIQAPQLDVNTVAAGGGSMLFFRSGLFVVGPESAGAHPGPACYRKGGPLTVTDANLCLGRLLPDYFPRIFGPSEDQPLSREDTLHKFQKLTADINLFQSGRPGGGGSLSVEEVAMGFIRVANEAMCRPIRSLTQAKGHDTSRHVLACFGGAGGQHACAIARSLGMKTVFIHNCHDGRRSPTRSRHPRRLQSRLASTLGSRRPWRFRVLSAAVLASRRMQGRPAMQPLSWVPSPPSDASSGSPHAGDMSAVSTEANAEVAVRDMLREFAACWERQTGALEVESVDHMDDGSPIKLKVCINKELGSATFDFSGSGHEVFGNCNAPRAITLSALIYCLRCMVGQDIPLNQGCLVPIQVMIPKGSILDPSLDAAVVGGNVLTSQRIVDVIFKAFQVCAASQGCMNNITFGNQKTGYYETVAGGAGAGPHWHGRSGIHTHMTNTRITDPEILEKRYPVVLKRFELCPGTGGTGRFCGGDGVIRELLFREDVILSVLTERRVFRPYGLQGGSPGAVGLNLLHRRDGRTINLGGKTSVPIQPGDVFTLQTPGGGGFGLEEDTGNNTPAPNKIQNRSFAERGSVFEYRMAQETV